MEELLLEELMKEAQQNPNSSAKTWYNIGFLLEEIGYSQKYEGSSWKNLRLIYLTKANEAYRIAIGKGDLVEYVGFACGGLGNLFKNPEYAEFIKKEKQHEEEKTPKDLNYVKECIEQAKASYNSNQFEEAERMLRRIIQEDKYNSEAYILLRDLLLNPYYNIYKIVEKQLEKKETQKNQGFFGWIINRFNSLLRTL